MSFEQQLLLELPDIGYNILGIDIVGNMYRIKGNIEGVQFQIFGSSVEEAVQGLIRFAFNQLAVCAQSDIIINE